MIVRCDIFSYQSFFLFKENEMNKNLLCKHFFYRNKFDEINSVKQGNDYFYKGWFSRFNLWVQT